ncbi:Peptidase M13 [Geranomyces variabilis]|nr:Peptidase M13 [Geranomyces variabilis]
MRFTLLSPLVLSLAAIHAAAASSSVSSPPASCAASSSSSSCPPPTFAPPSSKAHSPSHFTLAARNEEYQPLLTQDFPHLLGYKRIAAWSDPATQPCTDFYQHACGNFAERYASVGDTDVLDLMQRSSSLLMEQILDQPADALATTKTDRELFEKTRAYYDSCQNVDAIRKRGFKPILPYARDLVEYAKETDSLPELFARLHQDGVYALFKTAYTKVADNDQKDLRLQFYPAPAYDVSAETVRRALEPFVKHGVLRLPHGRDSLQRISAFVARIEKQTAKFITTLNARHEKSAGGSYAPRSNLVSMPELNARTRQDWSRYTRTLNMTAATANTEVYFWGDATVWIDAISELSAHDSRDLVWYFLWRLATAHYNKLNDGYYDLWADHIRPRAVRSAFDEDPSVDQSDVFQVDCIQETGVQLSYLAGHMFVKYAFNSTQRDAAKNLVDELVSSFSDRLSKLEWMDEQTKKAARDKLDNMISIVGYPPWLAEADTVANYYGPLRFDKNHYFENAVQAQSFALFAPSIHQSADTTRFLRDRLYFGYPWQLNAFHLTDYVQIQINPGILQRPLFSARNPASVNYGSLGMVIGHEITHGFDQSGRLLDKDGARRPWWTRASSQAFEKGEQCFRKQYSAEYVTLRNGEQLRVDGERTLAENVADNGGLRAAHAAWVSAEHKRDSGFSPADEEIAFGGLSKEQAFFMAFAQTWCSTRKSDERTRFLLKEDPHAPNRVRVNAAVANSVEFARAFGCKVGDPMRPREDKNMCVLY